MKFGAVPVRSAAGAILAHTHRLPSGGALKKGRVLTGEDIERLVASGAVEVVVAQLEQGDVPEDTAAAMCAAAAAASAPTRPGAEVATTSESGASVARPVDGEGSSIGVRVGEAATGRCNLYATHRGLLVFSPERLDAANLIDEALTIGTLPNFSVVEPGTMVATVKVIPFAVPQRIVQRCADAVRGLLNVHPFESRRAGLIVSTLPGMHDKQLDRAAKAQRMRVAYLGGEVVREVRCSHRVDAVAAHVRQMGTEGLNPILIMGASAIVDRGDVVPAAIVEVGGQLVHMGMPVDPGNLMLLARFGHIDVIGVPGCARSMKPSGYDWVLQRLAAGLSVGRRDIMRMGAGGLLNEIRARPLPRRDVDEQTAPAKIAAVVLAAGQSKRMGADNKLLADVQGVPMVVRVVRTLAESGVDRIIVVTGHESTQVAAQLRSVSGVELVHNPDYADGLSTSVRAGIRALDTDVDGALIALGDMPWVRSDHVRRLLDAFEPHGICVPVHDRKRGHPVLWSSRFFAEFEKLEGDVGARHLLERHADDVRLVPVDDRGVHIDVDTPQALAQLRDAWPGTTTE